MQETTVFDSVVVLLFFFFFYYSSTIFSFFFPPIRPLCFLLPPFLSFLSSLRRRTVVPSPASLFVGNVGESIRRVCVYVCIMCVSVSVYIYYYTDSALGETLAKKKTVTQQAR